MPDGLKVWVHKAATINPTIIGVTCSSQWEVHNLKRTPTTTTTTCIITSPHSDPSELFHEGVIVTTLSGQQMHRGRGQHPLGPGYLPIKSKTGALETTSKQTWSM